MPFTFRLRVPLRIARARRDAQRKEFAVLLRELGEAEARQREAEDRLLGLGEELARRAREGIDGRGLAVLSEAKDRVRSRIPGLRETVRVLSRREEELRLALAHTTREVTVLEKLRRRAYVEYVQDLARRERKVIEDVLLVRRARGDGAGEAAPSRVRRVRAGSGAARAKGDRRRPTRPPRAGDGGLPGRGERIMRLRGVLIAVLTTAVLANGVLVLDVMSGGGWLPFAEAGSAKTEAAPEKGAGRVETRDTKTPEAGEVGAREAEAAYRALVQELTEQKEALDKKARELAERERQLGVLRQELSAQKEQAAASAASAGTAKTNAAAPEGENMKRLIKAYSGMEPDNAARALQELYAKDRDIALDLFAGLSARKAAAILDALAALKPALAADISAEMSHRDEPRAQ